jgi:hypothetical protein
MDLAFIEYHPQRVLDAFRQGEFDALEILGQADERDFFERCFKERLLPQLAQDMPTTRRKEEVPRWFILAANLSLKLHQENSLMWFDEHNHPVEYEELTREQRQRVRRERCYKWISLLHLRGGCYVYAGALLVSGKAHEVGPFYDELVAQFVASVGQGVIKWLILDRGFIDGERISRCKRDWGIDVLIPMKKNMDIWADAWALAPQGTW